jgi:FlaA1/EpsC-like NDP-sugar epimerase/lipopolysaccharide/colanic/teichoic acid biosynthesis glycosyltransferase
MTPMGLRKTPRYTLLTVAYALILNVSYLAALFLRFEGEVPQRYIDGYLGVAPVFTLLSLFGFLVAGLFHGLWRYASTVTLFQVFKGVTLSAISLGLITFFTPEPLFPRSVIVMVWMVELVIMGGLRFAWRLSRERLLGPSPGRSLRTVVVGADHTGVHLIQEMRRSEDSERLTPIGFIDDEAKFTGHLVEGVPVLGTIADLPRVLQERKVEMVVVSDPSMPAKVVREIASFCAQARVRVKTLPGLSDLQQGRTALSQMRDMRIEDLLGRQPVQLDLEQMRDFLRGHRVLVTGAGGSIGSELVRQVAEFVPSELVLLDHSENGLYYVHNEVGSAHPKLNLHAVVMDIKDQEGLDRLFDRFRPTVVFHAAAHKHVPLLESNPREAVLNNVVGTRNLVSAADRAGVDKFVLISTDKAVNPTSVMGASKRVCEMLCQSRSQRSRTRFVAVRFGNVLGSDGSVIPLFQRQIQRGGPITVTHPEARRYFMTIPEAVRLVLQAGAMGKGGEVLLLDMGEQVRIVDLARQLIRMSGLHEGEDIDIVFTGLRPGEKLYEELHSDAERMRMTRHERILVWDLESRDEKEVLTEVAELEALAQDGNDQGIKSQLQRLVPEYSEPHHDPFEPVAMPETPVVELPAASALSAPVETVRWKETVRRTAEGGSAALVMAASFPLWIAMWVEARNRRQSMFVHETRVGRTRRRFDRRAASSRIAIDRRSIERRTQDVLGTPMKCVRFRTDLGPVSRWIGRYRLDKLPHLLNVIRWEMALVGPRAETEDHVLRWKQSIAEYERRFTVLPGLTGLAQISGYPDGDLRGIARRAQYDLYYVDHRSLLLDIRTLARTLSVLTRGDGYLRTETEVRPGNVIAGNFGPGATHSVGSRNVAAPAPFPVTETNEVKGVTP